MTFRLSSALLLALAWLVPMLAQAQTPLRDDLTGRLRLAALDHELVSDLARRHDLSTLEVLAANWGLDPWEPQTRERILLPTAHLLPNGRREGILINRAEYRLYYFKEGRLVLTAPIGTGHEGYETPLGETTVVRKQKDPTWFPTPATRAGVPDLPSVVPPGPENPLGAYALYLGWPTYLIHGTNDVYGVGRRFTRGCVRLFEDDIEALFNAAPVGTPVTVIDQPVKLGWHEDELFIEAYPDFAQLEELRIKLSFTVNQAERIDPWIMSAAGARAKDLDWSKIRSALERRSGEPVQITGTRTHPVDIVAHDLGF